MLTLPADGADQAPATPSSSAALLELPGTPVTAPPTVPSATPANPPGTPVTPEIKPAPKTTKNNATTHPLPVAPQTEEIPATLTLKQDVITPLVVKTLSLTEEPGNQVILEKPVEVSPEFSLMFSHKNMTDLIIPSLALYDAYKQQNSEVPAKKDELTDLLQSIQSVGGKKKVEKPLPNIYLGSIVYYSPSDWSIWVNSKKLAARRNAATNPLYVSRISPTSVVLVWKPDPFNKLGKSLKSLSDSKAVASGQVSLDSIKATVTLTLRPNQTFIPQTLVISEGLIKQVETANQDPKAAGSAPADTPPIAHSEKPVVPHH